MKTRSLRAPAIAGAALIASIGLTGCSADLGSINVLGMIGDIAKDGANLSSAEFSGFDIMFAQMMIPHHQQAVEMGTLAETLAFSPEVKALAAQIKAEQAPEIAQMKKWLTDAGSSMDMGHDMPMDGMLSAAALTALGNATGDAFDKLFLKSMILHHEGAIKMAQMVVDSSNAEAKALGEAIIASQTKQIEEMKALLNK